MESVPLIILVVVSVGLYFAGNLITKRDPKQASRQDAAMKFATWLDANGLAILAPLATSYAVKDLKGLFKTVQLLADQVKDATSVERFVNTFLTVQLKKKLADAESREVVLKIIETQLNIVIDRAALQPATTKLVKGS